MKVIDEKEMKMFCDIAQPYFEYMCRSFTQKYPTCMAKILGAFKIRITGSKKKFEEEYVILMENLTIGIDPNCKHLSKYDLKGSRLNRYVVSQDKKPMETEAGLALELSEDEGPSVTKLDTNFLEDHNSRPICLNYSLHRLMEIAIYNDTSFLNRYGKIDYSLLVWINHKTKLVRVGIIDYIQYYTIKRQMEYVYKKHVMNANGIDPTIMNPANYRERFKLAMHTYFLSLLGD